MTAYSVKTKSIALVDETVALRRCALYRNAFGATAISYSAALLGFNAVANWIRRNRVAVDVTTAGELEGAVSAAVDLARIVVHHREGECGADPGSAAAGIAGRRDERHANSCLGLWRLQPVLPFEHRVEPDTGDEHQEEC